MTDLDKIFEKLRHRVAEIRHYHNRFRDFEPGDDHGAVTYGIVMRSQVQDFLQLVQEWEEHSRS